MAPSRLGRDASACRCPSTDGYPSSRDHFLADGNAPAANGHLYRYADSAYRYTPAAYGDHDAGAFTDCDAVAASYADAFTNCNSRAIRHVHCYSYGYSDADGDSRRSVAYAAYGSFGDTDGCQLQRTTHAGGDGKQSAYPVCGDRVVFARGSGHWFVSAQIVH